jgi:phage terminase Nu1 subunit (DNA packaging protein)
MTPKPTPKPTLKALSEAIGVSVRRTSELKKDGMPTDSIAAAKRWRRDREANDSNSCERLRIERIKLVRVQRRRIEIEVARTRGELLPRAEVESEITGIAMAMQGFLRALEVELPQIVLGLPLERTRGLVKTHVRKLQELLADKTSEFWANHPQADGK